MPFVNLQSQFIEKNKNILKLKKVYKTSNGNTFMKTRNDTIQSEWVCSVYLHLQCLQVFWQFNVVHVSLVVVVERK